jgi:predicted glycoside hydrolase/deacetylase ChbG (UPF0249 family)
MMSTERQLIVNADDFGFSAGINRGIIKAFEDGIVTSTSFMVRWPHSEGAALYARAHPLLSVGLHFDLGEWVHRGGQRHALYEVGPEGDAGAIQAEFDSQVAQFRRLIGRDPTHLDSHQHVHFQEPARSIVIAGAQTLGVPLRHVTPTIHFCGEFYGQDSEGETLEKLLQVDYLVEILRGLPNGTTELMCHPGLGDDIGSVYGTERTREVEILRDPRVPKVLEAERIKLCSFHDL